MYNATDPEIVAAAIAEGSVILTLDADFHSLVALSGLTVPSVVRLRREGCRADEVVRILSPVLARYELQLKYGSLVSVNDYRATSRTLPIGATSNSA